jgi:hypothetical protein
MKHKFTLYILISIIIILIILSISYNEYSLNINDTNSNVNHKHPFRDIPIDIIYTYVDSTDKKWNELKTYEKNKIFSTEETSHTSLYDSSLEEIRFSLRSIEKYLNVNYRNIYFVTNNGKLPNFLKKSPRFIPILYSDLLGNTSYNSFTIETCLHKIKGLSEYYLYFNDDMILMNNLNIHDLITTDGKPIWYSESSLFINAANKMPFFTKIFNLNDGGCNLARQRTYKQLGLNYKPDPISHSPRMFKKSLVIEFYNKFKSYLDEQYNRKFRSADDFCFIDAFCHYFNKINKLEYSNKYKTCILCQFDSELISKLYNWTDNSLFLCVEDMRNGDKMDKRCVNILNNMFKEPTEHEK